MRHLSKVRKPVSPDPIQLAIYSPKVPNLTMVDMPGEDLQWVDKTVTVFAGRSCHYWLSLASA